ncbi:N-acetylneuraminate synthase family protein, partial [Archangium violaceum]|uniref:N-acetylneuraminate synthase family protein n=1 Tax=Archangium violaceum TaxID=83451 RepID=UPI001F27557B
MSGKPGEEGGGPPREGTPRVARAWKPQGTRVRVGQVEVGGPGFVVMAGPCAVEGMEQTEHTASAVAAAGAHVLRGGVFKPRTSPYSFQGMGEPGLRVLAEAARKVGLPIVSEVMESTQIPMMEDSVDVLQVGARNMQNFPLLRALGKTRKPVLLKRGLAATF